jgi:hypothetical protein
MIRSGRKYFLKEVLPFVFNKTKQTGKKSLQYKKNYDGDLINMTSQRLRLFKENSVCVSCGLKGMFFVKEKHLGQSTYHFNMYGIKCGEEILFTKDHIIPKSKGGKNKLSNYQTMCVLCNMEKADNVA